MRINKILMLILAGCLLLTVSCQTLEKKTAANLKRNDEALKALNESRFQDAFVLSQKSIDDVPDDSKALAINVISSYILMVIDVRTGIENIDKSSPLTIIPKFNEILSESRKKLSDIDRKLEILSADEGFKFAFAPGVLQIDFDGDGSISSKEANILAVKKDRNGGEIEPQKPVIMFDHSDVLYARMMVNLNLALNNMVSSLDFSEMLAAMTLTFGAERKNEFVIKLRDRKFLADAHGNLVTAVELSAKTRDSVLSETDDDMEFVPNPSQKNTAATWDSDVKFFEEWKIFNGFMKELIKGEKVLSFNGIPMGRQVPNSVTAKGGIDIKKLMLEPHDAVLNTKEISEKTELMNSTGNIDEYMESIFGEYYVYDKPASGIVKKIVEKYKEEKERAALEMEKNGEVRTLQDILMDEDFSGEE